MPQLLPAHLRTGIDYESIDTAPIDLLEDLPEDCYSEEERATKRLRIETIATSYLHGTRPMISTAGLRGPFDKWHNPWGRREEEDDNTCRDKNQKRMSGRALGRRNVNSRSVAQGRSTATRVPHRRDDGARKTRDKEEPSKTIQDFSAPVQKSPEDVPTTRTRLSVNRGSLGAEANITTWQPDQTVAPSPPAWIRTCVLHADTKSSAPASMPISSPLKPVVTVVSSKSVQCAHQRNDVRPVRLQPSDYSSTPSQPTESNGRPPDSRDRPLQSGMKNMTPAGQHAASSQALSNFQGSPVNVDSPTILHLQEASPVVIEGHISAKRLAWMAIQQTSLQTGQEDTPILRDDMQCSPERRAQETPTLSIAQPLKRRSTRKPGKEPINHDLIASPGPASSTGFIYRKTAKTRDKERSKPRLVSFNSSPGPAKENHVLGQPRLDPHLPEGDGEGHSLKTVTEKVQSSRPDVYDIMANDMATNDIGTVVVEGHGGEGAQGSRRVSRLSSNYSTQAALLLAQMEFQEGTKSPVSYDTPRAAWFPQDDTPRPNRRQSSPLITPFHAFNEELSKRLPPESVLRGPPMSTQDLFAAASPFAFSAVKKTTIRKPAMSSLRVSVLSKDGDEHADVDVTRSPTTSAERIPLKDRNHKMSFMVTPVSGSDKGSQDSLLHSSRPWRRDVELPQLDLGTLLDDVGPNGDLEFTDRFLRNLGAIS